MNEDITRPIRHYRITAILNRKRVNSQNQLMSLLEKEGISVTQATLSRDLNELGAKKMRPLEGPAYYVVDDVHPAGLSADPGLRGRLRRLLKTIAVSMVETDAGVFIRTPPGGAQYLASVIDLSGQPEILGSIAGDYTILVFAKKPFTISELLLLLTELAGFTNGQNPVRPDDLLDEGRASSPATPTDK